MMTELRIVVPLSITLRIPVTAPVDVRVGNAASGDDCPLILCVRNPPDPRRAPTRIHFLLDAVVISDSTFSRNAKNVPWKNGQRRRIYRLATISSLFNGLSPSGMR